jgi:hypothetical protein
MSSSGFIGTNGARFTFTVSVPPGASQVGAMRRHCFRALMEKVE